MISTCYPDVIGEVFIPVNFGVELKEDSSCQIILRIEGGNIPIVLKSEIVGT